jgi:hypothetical protein
VKVLIAMAIVAVLLGLATPWVRDRANDYLHDSFDTALPSKIESRVWTSLEHGKALRTTRVRFHDGTLTTARCHTTLGTYSVKVNHAFAFTKASPVRPGCPGRKLQRELARATRVVVESDGRFQRLVFTDKDDHTVAQLQRRGA